MHRNRAAATYGKPKDKQGHSVVSYQHFQARKKENAQKEMDAEKRRIDEEKQRHKQAEREKRSNMENFIGQIRSNKLKPTSDSGRGMDNSDIEKFLQDEEDAADNTTLSRHDQLVEQGRKNNWPSTCDTAKIQEFTRQNIKWLKKILQGKEQSPFRDRVEELLKNHKGSIVDQTTAIEGDWIPGTGYYGSRGWIAASTEVSKQLQKQTKEAIDNKFNWMAKFTRVMLVYDTVLIPEVMTKLYMQEQGISKKDATQLLYDADEYGNEMFRDVVEGSDEGSDYEDEFEIMERGGPDGKKGVKEKDTHEVFISDDEARNDEIVDTDGVEEVSIKQKPSKKRKRDNENKLGESKSKQPKKQKDSNKNTDADASQRKLEFFTEPQKKAADNEFGGVNDHREPDPFSEAYAATEADTSTQVDLANEQEIGQILDSD